MDVKKVGIVGFGLMGSGISNICAQAGYEVTVSDLNDEFVKKGMAAVEKTLDGSIERGKMKAADKEVILSKIKGTTNIADFADVDLVIECVKEDMGIKKNTFAKLDEACKRETILATNTSTLSVIDIATATKRQEKVIGTHFFNPAHVMKLLEIVRTIATSDDTLETVKKFGTSLGKSPVVSKDTPGFIPTRLGMVQALEAIRMVEAGIGTAEDIDTALKLSYNYPMGPLELTDLVGVDIRLSAAESLYASTRDPKFAPPILMQKMVAAGWLGRKAGKGFYDYGSK